MNSTLQSKCDSATEMRAIASQEMAPAGEQYGLAKILGIWGMATLPMSIIVHSAESLFLPS